MHLRKITIPILLIVLIASCQQSDEAIFKNAVELAEKGKHNEAIPYFSQLVERNRNNERALFERGISWYYLDSNQKALDDLNRILASKPKQQFEFIINPVYAKGDDRWKVSTIDVLYQRALVKYGMDSLKSAYIDFKTSLENDYETARCNVYIGSILMTSGQKDKACEYYRQAAFLGDKEAAGFIEKGCR